MKALFWYAAICLVVLSGCLPDAMLTPTAVEITATPTQTPTTTATIIWFPATATFTPAPTQVVTPTEDLRPVRGAVLLEDPFTDKTQWQTGRTGAGSIAYGKSDLTLAVSQPRGTLISLRKAPQLSDYYLEIDALPSLCRDGDMYGVLLRAESSEDFYRLLISCSGQVRMERVKNAKVAPLQDWITSGQVLPGGMMPSRVGVWASGQSLHVFINEVFHFSIKDPVFSIGTIGVYARSAGDTPLTVSFSNLVVYSIASGRLPGLAKTPTLATSTQKP